MLLLTRSRSAGGWAPGEQVFTPRPHLQLGRLGLQGRVVLLQEGALSLQG